MQFTEINWSPNAIATRTRSEAQTEVDDAVKASFDAGRAMAVTIPGHIESITAFLKMIRSAGRFHRLNVAVPVAKDIMLNADGTATIPFLARAINLRGPRKPKVVETADTINNPTPSA